MWLDFLGKLEEVGQIHQKHCIQRCGPSEALGPGETFRGRMIHRIHPIT